MQFKLSMTEAVRINHLIINVYKLYAILLTVGTINNTKINIVLKLAGIGGKWLPFSTVRTTQ